MMDKEMVNRGFVFLLLVQQAYTNYIIFFHF